MQHRTPPQAASALATFPELHPKNSKSLGGRWQSHDLVRSCQTRKRKKKGRIQSPHVTPTLAATLHRWQAAVRRPEARTLSRASAQLSEPVPLAEISPLVPHHNSQDFDDITPLRLSVSASTLSTDRSAQPQRWRTSTPPSPCELASSSVTPCLAVSRWSCEFAPSRFPSLSRPRSPESKKRRKPPQRKEHPTATIHHRRHRRPKDSDNCDTFVGHKF